VPERGNKNAPCGALLHWRKRSRSYLPAQSAPILAFGSHALKRTPNNTPSASPRLQSPEAKQHQIADHKSNLTLAPYSSIDEVFLQIETYVCAVQLRLLAQIVKGGLSTHLGIGKRVCCLKGPKMTTAQCGSPPLAKLLWQPDLFNRRSRRGPMRTIWCEHEPDEVRHHRRKLLPQSKLVLNGRSETDGPFGVENQVYMWFRHAPGMTACALCVEDNPFDEPSPRGLPRPTLLYLYPSSTDQQTLVRWLLAEYLATRADEEFDIEQMGQFDLTGVIEVGAGLETPAGGCHAS
jgi:hypothetical protein